MECPQCKAQMIGSPTGWACPNCGHTEAVIKTQSQVPSQVAPNVGASNPMLASVERASETMVAAEMMNAQPGSGIGINIGTGTDGYNPAYGFYPRNRPANRIAGFIMMMVFGLIFLAFGWAFYSIAAIPASYMRTTGQVNSINSIYSQTRHGGGYTYSPNIVFSVNGQQYRFSDQISTGTPSFSVGQTVQVAYNPHDPSQAKNASDRGGWPAAIFSGSGGLFFCVLAFVILLKKPNNSLAPQPLNNRPVQGDN